MTPGRAHLFGTSDIEEAAKHLAFYADHDGMEPEEWLKTWHDCQRITMFRRAVIKRAKEILEKRK